MNQREESERQAVVRRNPGAFHAEDTHEKTHRIYTREGKTIGIGRTEGDAWNHAYATGHTSRKTPNVESLYQIRRAKESAGEIIQLTSTRRDLHAYKASRRAHNAAIALVKALDEIERESEGKDQ